MFSNTAGKNRGMENGIKESQASLNRNGAHTVLSTAAVSSEVRDTEQQQAVLVGFVAVS